MGSIPHHNILPRNQIAVSPQNIYTVSRRSVEGFRRFFSHLTEEAPSYGISHQKAA
jgi:predicted glycosyltransferase involved in capsule biosynthesis